VRYPSSLELITYNRENVSSGKRSTYGANAAQSGVFEAVLHKPSPVLFWVTILAPWFNWAQPVRAAPGNNTIREFGRSTRRNEREADIFGTLKITAEPTSCHQGLTAQSRYNSPQIPAHIALR
jgi:hypothetical protein